MTTLTNAGFDSDKVASEQVRNNMVQATTLLHLAIDNLQNSQLMMTETFHIDNEEMNQLNKWLGEKVKEIEKVNKEIADKWQEM